VKHTVKVTSLCALVVLVGFSLLLVTRHPVSEATNTPSPLLGKMAPPLRGHELGGGEFNLTQHRGQVVVVNFWASWCVACQQEAPALSTFAWQERHRVVVLIGVVFDDTLSAALAFQRHYGSLYRSLVDPGGTMANSYGVSAPPTTFVINPLGRVMAELIGPVNAHQLESVVRRVRI
jgi:cytochrome c biogenesis protein CcmG/thiol:disulfide interchange protein DsbE